MTSQSTYPSHTLSHSCWPRMHTLISSIALLYRDYFKDFTKLAFVRLNRNQLSDKGVPKAVFNVSTLLDLQLSHNQLASVPLFSSHLEHLHLNHNSIESKLSQQQSEPAYSLMIRIKCWHCSILQTAGRLDFYISYVSLTSFQQKVCYYVWI